MNKSRVCVITGGAGGIGKAICDMLLKNDEKAVILDIEIDKIRAEYEKYIKNNRLIALKTNICSEQDTENAFKQIVDEMGTVDVLINNAGILSTDGVMKESI